MACPFDIGQPLRAELPRRESLEALPALRGLVEVAVVGDVATEVP
jgi:hypothetical protein